jgi:hypothetical protein
MSEDGWDRLLAGGVGAVSPLLFKTFGMLTDQGEFSKQIEQLGSHVEVWLRLTLLISACLAIGCVTTSKLNLKRTGK